MLKIEGHTPFEKCQTYRSLHETEYQDFNATQPYMLLVYWSLNLNFQDVNNNVNKDM